jgi:pilus assembly protein FimV
MRVKLLILLAFVVFLPIPSIALAVVLSEVDLETHLNQPLSARIELRQISMEDLDSLDVQISEITDTVTSNRHTVLNYEVVTEGANHYLRISSRDAIREPILSFVVELNWARGHMIRNYALIIDPQ